MLVTSIPLSSSQYLPTHTLCTPSPVNGRLLTLPLLQTFPQIMGKSKVSYALSDMSYDDLETSVTLDVPIRILGERRDRDLQTP